MQFTDAGAAVLAVFGLAFCAAVLILIPRAVEPTETPGLSLDRAAINAQLAADKATAAKVPTDKAGAYVVGLWHRFNSDTSSGAVIAYDLNKHRTARILALRTVRNEKGDAISDTYRAQAAEDAIPAITGRMSQKDMYAKGGRLIDTLFRYDMAKDKFLLAPSFVIRCAAKARWNGIFARQQVEGFTNIEKQAYYGWIAFRAASIDPANRLDALDQYEKAGGRKSLEARASLLYGAGNGMHAAKLYEKLYATTHNLRYRNHAKAALVLAGGP